MRRAVSPRARRQPVCPCRRARAVSETVKSPPSRAWAWLGLRLVETGDGTAVVGMTTTEDMANHSRFPHAGLVSTLAHPPPWPPARTLYPSFRPATRLDL